jgi:hypothetical protein
VRDWYVESFRELRAFPGIKNGAEEAAFSDLLRNIYRRHVGRGLMKSGFRIHGLLVEVVLWVLRHIHRRRVSLTVPQGGSTEQRARGWPGAARGF